MFNVRHRDPTEMVTEIKEGGRRVESEKKVFRAVSSAWKLDDAAGWWFATPGVTGSWGADGNPSAHATSTTRS